MDTSTVVGVVVKPSGPRVTVIPPRANHSPPIRFHNLILSRVVGVAVKPSRLGVPG